MTRNEITYKGLVRVFTNMTNLRITLIYLQGLWDIEVTVTLNDL